MRRSLTTVCVLVGLTIALGGCSGQQWGGDAFGWMRPGYRRVTPGEIGRVVITPRETSERLVYRPVEAETLPRRPAAAVGDPAWHAASNGRQWRYIVIHHSATRGGNAQQFDTSHRQVRGFDELGYHFVIDNGNGGPDGRVEVGSRWPKQKHGAHTGGTPDNEYNETGIGICLVGDFTTGMPTAAQLASLNRLTAYLAETYDIPPANVITHQDAPGGDTACPGGQFHAYVHGRFKISLRQKLAAARRAWRSPSG